MYVLYTLAVYLGKKAVLFRFVDLFCHYLLAGNEDRKKYTPQQAT
jgi:hypothetical protein